MSTPKNTNSVVIRDKAFAERLASSVDNHPRAPHGHGRQRWLLNELEARFSAKYSAESARKWFAGENRPKVPVLRQIAEILEVDEAWLSLGIDPDETPKERVRRNATADGAVNYVAGLIQMAGGNIAFPEQDDQAQPDIFAIISGRSIQFEVKRPAGDDEGNLRLRLSKHHDKRVVLIVADAKGPMNFNVFRIPPAIVAEFGRDRGGFVEMSVVNDGKKLSIGDHKLAPLTSLDLKSLE